MLQQLGQAIHEILSSALGIDSSATELKFEQPPEGLGDVALCCIPFARTYKTNPNALAETIARDLARYPIVFSAQAAGPYVNMRFNTAVLFGKATKAIAEKAITTTHPDRIMVEYLSPNTNKPLHLGHVRNGVLGTALANLLREAGHTVIRANLVNDRGVHISKSMLAYQWFFNGQTPESSGKKGDHFVGDCYVAYAKAKKADPNYDENNDPEALAMLGEWEKGNPDVLALWKRMNAWVYEGFEATYKRYGFLFDKIYYESDLYLLGKDIVEDGLSRGVFVKDPDHSINFMLPEEKFGLDKNKKQKLACLIRQDGTSVYITQDLGTAVRKVEDFNLDRSLYVVATEQDNHFKVLFEILEKLGHEWAKKCYHFSYGMVELPEGRMKSREGTVVDADDLLDDMTASAVEASMQRGSTLSDAEEKRRAEIVALAAIKFYLLRFKAASQIVFDPKTSLSFEGDTGPYCLYAYARIQSIFEKARLTSPTLLDGLDSLTFSHIGNDEERALAWSILNFPESVRHAAEVYDPSSVAEQVLLVARKFNRFYKEHKVITEDDALTRERLSLAKAAGEAIHFGLSLLGIPVLEKM